VTASDEQADPGEWLEAPFEGADPQRVICRFDVSTVFDDDLDDVDVDDEDDDEVEAVEDDEVEPLDADRR
jgi:hypothetical protein